MAHIRSPKIGEMYYRPIVLSSRKDGRYDRTGYVRLDTRTRCAGNAGPYQPGRGAAPRSHTQNTGAVSSCSRTLGIRHFILISTEGVPAREPLVPSAFSPRYGTCPSYGWGRSCPMGCC